MKLLKTLPIYALLALLLSNCTVYDSVFHPHRLPTPPLSATAKAKAKAAEKARHKGLTLKAPEPIADGASAEPAAPAAPAGAAAAVVEKPKTLTYNELPEGTKLTYDKQGLLKKKKLERVAINRRRLHYYDTRPLTPREASRENRRIRKKGSKGRGKDAPHGKVPADAPLDRSPAPAAEPTPEPTQPAAKPAKVKAKKVEKPKVEKAEKIKVEKPKKEKEEKVKGDKKAKKAILPKPDPTQPQPFKGDQ